jgi:hypothetical protein
MANHGSILEATSAIFGEIASKSSMVAALASVGIVGWDSRAICGGAVRDLPARGAALTARRRDDGLLRLQFAGNFLKDAEVLPQL